MRKIAAFYYLGYPDSAPPNPRDAASEMYVEVGQDDASVEHFDETFSFQVYTTERLKREIQENGFVVLRSAIVVDYFDDEAIEHALNQILDRIEEYGSPKE